MIAHAALQVLAPLLEFAAADNDREPLPQTEQKAGSPPAGLVQHNSIDLNAAVLSQQHLLTMMEGQCCALPESSRDSFVESCLCGSLVIS